MKNKLWLLQLPVILFFTCAYLIADFGLQGELPQPYLQKAYRASQRLATTFTDFKFRLRGHQKPRNNVIVVEVDSGSIEEFGRWPWHRDVIAQLIEETFKAGAKVVGMDMVFSEPDQRVPTALQEKLAELKLDRLGKQMETDLALADTIFNHSKRLVLGWANEANCKPSYGYRGGEGATVAFDPDVCPISVEDPRIKEFFPKGFERFAFDQMNFPKPFNIWKSSFFEVLTFIPNLESYNSIAEHSGYFNVFPDQDGVIRRIPLLMMHQGVAYPSLALDMVRVGQGKKLKIDINDRYQVADLSLVGEGGQVTRLPVSNTGAMEFNFRGPGRTFPYVAANELIHAERDVLLDEVNGGGPLKGKLKKDVFKDAYVLIGVSALGANDMRNFPYDENVAGVEGHATAVDNLLSGDMISAGSHVSSRAWILALMLLGVLLFAYGVERLEAVPAVALFVGTFAAFGVVDVALLFRHNVNWLTGFFYVEIFTVFVITMAGKYVLEERNKKFVKSAFAKYVAPSVVDSILKDPAKLSVGGEKRELTIMFSDIRSFTTFSERLDARALAAFLNDYLSIMTKLVFASQGTLDKYIGDAIMAFWGAPLEDAKHAFHCCQGAIAMMKALGENHARFLKDFGVDVNIGIGINTGAVNVGNMGSADNFSYTVIGDHVNLSSRLEGLTKYYGVAILTTRFTFDAVAAGGDALPPHRVLDHVKVKGKKNAVELIQVLDREMPADGLKTFEEARQLYRAQRFDEAIAKFQAASAALSPSAERKDGPSEMFIERCQELKAAPPGPDWDGSHEMTSK